MSSSRSFRTYCSVSAIIVSASGCTPGGSHSAAAHPPSTRCVAPWASPLPPNARTNAGMTARYVLVSPKAHRAIGSVLNARVMRSEEHTSELQSQSNLVCRLLLEKKKKKNKKKRKEKKESQQSNNM